MPYIIGILVLIGIIGCSVDSCKSALGLGGSKQIAANQEMERYVAQTKAEADRKIGTLEKEAAGRRAALEAENKASEDRFWADREEP